jgi:HlyD family secretion protein
MKKAPRLAVLAAAVLGLGYYAYRESRPQPLVLTGVVTTSDVIVSPQITGRITRLLVKEGDAVKAGQLLAVLSPDELREDRAFYAATAAGVTSQVHEGEAALLLQQRQTTDQITQADATLSASEQQRSAAQAELDNAQRIYDRADRMAKQGISTAEQLDGARMTLQVAKSRLASLEKQTDAQRSAAALARTNAQQIAVRRSQLQATERQAVAAVAQQQKADVRLAYTELHAPMDGLVDVRAARPGEVVTAGQPIVTLIDPDDLWIRADVEESYIDGVRIGDTLTVRLPSGDVRQGTVFHRGVDAGFATQRDVSRVKRDIKTFEIRLRVDNADRKLAVGMTAYVLMPAR